LLFEHLLHSLLEGSKPLALFQDVVLLEVPDPLVDAVFDRSFMLLGNLDSFGNL
jgi:hypothetical protein